MQSIPESDDGRNDTHPSITMSSTGDLGEARLLTPEEALRLLRGLGGDAPEALRRYCVSGGLPQFVFTSGASNGRS